MKKFNGKVLFLDRSDINTDEIIPAKYLTENTKEDLKPYLLEDLVLKGFNSIESLKDVGVIVTRENFGCGSSREHAPWALEVNGINIVLAISFARIFRQNMYNCGMMAVELPAEVINSIFEKFSHKETFLETDTARGVFVIKSGDEELIVDYSTSGFDRELVKAGGWVNYADSRY